MTYTITAAYLTEYYDNDETRETEIPFPKTATLEKLIEDAKAMCKVRHQFSDDFAKMTMNEVPDIWTDIQDGEGCIDISFEFELKENDFRTDMRVSYTVKEEKK